MHMEITFILLFILQICPNMFYDINVLTHNCTCVFITFDPSPYQNFSSQIFMTVHVPMHLQEHVPV